MDTYLEFLLSCVNSPMDTLECGPFWLVVSTIALGGAVTLLILIVHSFDRWYRMRNMVIELERRAAQDAQDRLKYPDLAN